jgi:hypothetical protein
MRRLMYRGVVIFLGVLAATGGTWVGARSTRADVHVYRDSRGVLHITNTPARSSRASKADHSNGPRFTGRLIDVQSELRRRREETLFVADPSTTAAIHVYRDSQGILHYTNVPNHPYYRPLFLVQTYASRLSGKDSVEFDRLIEAACERYGVEFALVKAVIKAESAFDPLALSRAGARGLMQLMPETAMLHRVADIHAPYDNIEGGVRHLRLLLDQFDDDVPLALAAYNAGAGAVMRYNGIPPYQETQEYVRRVLQYREAYRARSALDRPLA